MTYHFINIISLSSLTDLYIFGLCARDSFALFLSAPLAIPLWRSRRSFGISLCLFYLRVIAMLAGQF